MSTFYESLLPKLVTILQLTEQAEGAPTLQTRQALVQTTNDFKDTLRQAKEMASALAGGELSVEEQDEVIEMLEQLKGRKRQQLEEFSTAVVCMSTATAGMQVEVDSTASTPAA